MNIKFHCNKCMNINASYFIHLYLWYVITFMFLYMNCQEDIALHHTSTLKIYINDGYSVMLYLQRHYLDTEIKNCNPMS